MNVYEATFQPETLLDMYFTTLPKESALNPMLLVRNAFKEQNVEEEDKEEEKCDMPKKA